MASATERLTGWKAIAAFLAVDVRTARRWEAERGLPVRRLPGTNRSAVWADPAEMRRWLAAGPDVPAAPAPIASALPTAPVQAAGRQTFWLLVPALALMALIALWVWARTPAAAPALPFADAAANRQWLDAGHAAASRTPAGLDRAAALYADLARRHPDAAAPFAGLAETWLLMREFAGLPDEAAFRRARDAAEAALALDPDQACALRALGFTLFWTEADQARGLALLARATKAGGATDARALHWYGNALAFAGQPAAALPILAQARVLAPESAAIAADEAQVRFIAGARLQAVASLQAIVRSRPGFIGGWRYLEWDLLAEGDAPGFLAAARTHAQLRGDQHRLALMERAADAHAAGGMPALLTVLIADAQRHHAETGSDAIAVARLQALAGDRAAVRYWVLRAQARREPFAHMLAGWPELQPLQNDPSFADLFARRPA